MMNRRMPSLLIPGLPNANGRVVWITIRWITIRFVERLGF